MMYSAGILYGLERRGWRRRAVSRAGTRIHRKDGLRPARLLFKLCLLAALAAEAAWFCGALVRTERFTQIEERESPASESGSVSSGIRFRLEDGEFSLFKIEEYSLPASD